jgi:hypothetical protein
MWTVRIILAALFFAVMTGWRIVVHPAVAAGPIPWLIMMGLILAAAIAIENARRAEDRLPYKAASAESDVS